MTDLERFRQNAQSKGLLVDANLLVLYVVGAVNRARIAQFKRTQIYQPRDFDKLCAIMRAARCRYASSHLLAEVSNLTDLKGRELFMARELLKREIAIIEELPVTSRAASQTDCYPRLGLTDSAIGLIAQQRGCSVITSDLDLYRELLRHDVPVINFNHLRVD